MQTLTTERLLIKPLTKQDASFIFELVNTEGWLRFIGDRNVHSIEDAIHYIAKILGNPKSLYWVVSLANDKAKVGIITFIQRDYLECPDIGFAFLPDYCKMGYAYEATKVVLENLISDNTDLRLAAVTVPDNEASIKLMRKLSFCFEKELIIDDKKLHIYTANSEKLMIDKIAGSFFNAFTNINNKLPDTQSLKQICISEAMIICNTNEGYSIHNLETFITTRQKILTDGTLTQFEEYETYEETKINNTIAQRYSEYAKSGILHGSYFKQKGHKFFQFVRTKTDWKLCSVLWEDEKSESQSN